jgi:hypothetical protein
MPCRATGKLMCTLMMLFMMNDADSKFGVLPSMALFTWWHLRYELLPDVCRLSRDDDFRHAGNYSSC